MELFYAHKVVNKKFILSDDETKHAVRVMRKKIGEEIYATDGRGNIYKGKIESVEKNILFAEILETQFREKTFPNIKFFIPNLRNKDRLRFAVEKLTELGITNIIIYSSERTVSRNLNIDKWEKVALAAMKQSLHAHLPKIEFLPQVKDFRKRNEIKTVLLDQEGEISVNDFLSRINLDDELEFFIGPEGDFTETEKELIASDYNVKLDNYRFRSETAVISLASAIVLCLKS
jgi:16S rRNA (uracil1498-N3)-methyltransferase